MASPELLPRLATRAAPRAGRLSALAAAAVLAACGSTPDTAPGDNAPTLKTLAGKRYAIAADPGIPANEERAIQAYREFLQAAPNAPQRPQAMRRLGDLAMEAADTRAATAGSGAPADPDYATAIARYQDYLKAYPNAEDTDRVLYQLARAQEQGGQLETALKTLDRLVANHPRTRYLDEAQFRRGELLFTARQYPAAERAYQTVLATPDSVFRERALYMHGWSVFKQGKLEEALHSFFGVLDLKLADLGTDAPLEEVESLSRADRELLEDTFRVTSLSLENLQGAASIPAYITSDARRSYEFRVYGELAGLYLRQDRPKDAADTLTAFVRRQPQHAQAPSMQAQVIEIHQQAGFATLALDAKRDYVARYGADSDYRRANPEAWERSQPLLKTHLTELATHHHAAAQKSRSPAEVQEAVRWYRAWLAAFPEAPEAPKQHFLLAELLFENQQFAASAAEYETSAYRFPAHPQSADAGYAALLSYVEQDKRAQAENRAAEHTALQTTQVDSGLRFAERFPSDARTPAVLTNAAERLYNLGQGERAATVAQQVIALQPPAEPALRRVAWTVVAHTAFEAGAHERAEAAYGEVLALTPANDGGRAALTERLAAAIYKQGEQARSAGQTQAAAGHFARVASAAPDSSVRTAAQFDAAAAQLALKDWAGAAATLEDFRRRFPRHALAEQVPARLALAYTELGRWPEAAAEYERVAAGPTASNDPALARSAQWQAAELYDKAAAQGSPAARAQAAKAWERYLRQHPRPLEPALEARHRLAQIAEADRQPAQALAWQREILAADQAGGAERTGRTRTLAAMAALALAEPVRVGYEQVKLVEPLQRQLKLKKARMEEALKAYAVAADYGVAEVTTAATYQTASVYQDFGKSLIGSERPKKLSKLEREQYDVLLEEQAFPFEEKAIELHELNAGRATQGVYDEWVKKSFVALRGLRPVRWGKVERADDAGASAAVPLNRQAVQWRERGEFAKARAAYEQALAADPAYAPAALNLGVLHDLYLGQPDQALPLYEKYLALTPGGDAAVAKWVADLKKRRPAAPPPAASAPASAPAAGTAAAPAAAAPQENAR